MAPKSVNSVVIPLPITITFNTPSIQPDKQNMDPAALRNLTPEQKQAVMAQAQGQANQEIMAAMVENMTSKCFAKCVGTSVSESPRYLCLRIIVSTLDF